MAYLITILVTIALFSGFLWLTSFETRRGRRLFASTRASFDREAHRVEFVFAHVDFASAIRSLALSAAERAAHDIAHAGLILVRGAERLLTRAVRALRARRAANAPASPIIDADTPPAPTTTLGKTMHGFREHLRRHPKSPRPSSVETTEEDAVE